MITNKATSVLLTSVGGLTGTYLTKLLSEKYQLIGIDMSEHVPLKQELRRFYRVPAVINEGYIPTLEEIIKREKIDIIIPVSSYDMNVLSKCHYLLEKYNVDSCMMDYEWHSKLHNKATCYRYLNSLGIATPKIFTKIRFPLVMKENESSGSKGTQVIQNLEDYNYWKKKMSDYILTEYLDGDEYTVDCLFGYKGENLGFNIRKRVKTSGGGAVITTNTYTYAEQIEMIINKLTNSGKIKGPVNFQFKVKENEIYIFDFNTRFASGGLPLTVESGFNIPERLVKLIMEKNVQKWNLNFENEGLTMIRYYNETFVK